MLIHLLVVALICVSWCIMPVVGQGTLMSQDEAVKKLKSAESLVEKEMASIWKTWDIDNYPNFLQSAGITHTSWEVMKLKYKAKILNTLLDTITDEEKSFVVAYMGSSVTAGHDSPVKDNFVSLTQTHMEAAFQELGIKFESRQSGMGNNPCEPYDLCPKTFSGEDADVVHWEQSYNCFGNDNNKQGLFEQFVRQCIHMPRPPWTASLTRGLAADWYTISLVARSWNTPSKAKALFVMSILRMSACILVSCITAVLPSKQETTSNSWPSCSCLKIGLFLTTTRTLFCLPLPSTPSNFKSLSACSANISSSVCGCASGFALFSSWKSSIALVKLSRYSRRAVRLSMLRMGFELSFPILNHYR